MMDAVHRYEGTVNQVMGDGIMALFGAPLAHEDHAVCACYAALRMQESSQEPIAQRSGARPGRPAYSMNRSTRSWTVGGIVTPRARAVLAFTTSSNRVGCSTGRSAGLAPFRILSA